MVCVDSSIAIAGFIILVVTLLLLVIVVLKKNKCGEANVRPCTVSCMMVVLLSILLLVVSGYVFIHTNFEEDGIFGGAKQVGVVSKQKGM